VRCILWFYFSWSYSILKYPPTFYLRSFLFQHPLLYLYYDALLVKRHLIYLGIFTRVLLYTHILVSWGGVRLSPLGTSATNWPIVPAPDDRWWVWSSQWNENWQGIPKYSEKTCASVTLSTTNPTWPGLGSNTGLRSGKPATNRLSYDAAPRIWIL
jgi:hypothetical protein